MGDYDLDTLFDLAGIPRLPLRRIHARAQDCRSDSLVHHDSLQSRGHIMLLGVDCEHLATAPFLQFVLDLFNELSFLRIKLIFREILALCDDKTNVALEFGIKLSAVESSETIGMVRIEQQGVEHRAQH